ncbi:eclosion hormone [Culex quinquefasciatus]|uniref:Eclosion hormone n=1 Tax=Culex quinquefasciatus TaxID=7176 RepID=B0WXK2_CULQU|nr:eclosion hormone [Culex quinquefasciatus]EDS36532.1 eclosion hormone [Culex quinquefasciatus]|eukprot:XP_001862124.1 eclosion hormone [Culex quinquefasciatus]
MNPSKLSISTVLIAFCAFAFIEVANSNPTMDLFGGYEIVSVCMTNCAQCKRMYGTFFDGQVCAEACLEFKGKIIPDCEDIGSIAGFLNRAELKKYA